MTRLFTAGGEEDYPAALWDVLPVSINTILHKYNDASQSAVLPRTGAGCYKNYSSINLWGKKLDNPTGAYLGVAFNTAGVNSGFTFLELSTSGVANQMGGAIRLDTNGVLRAYRSGTLLASSAASSFGLNVWHYLEMYYLPRNVNGRITVKIDGTQIVDYTGDTTDNNEYIEYLVLNNANAIVYFDDIVVNSDAGTTNNTWPGQVRLFPARPLTLGGINQMSRAGVDLGSNVAHADWRYSDGSVLQAIAANQTDYFTMETPAIPAGAVIKNVIVQGKGRVYNGSGSGALLCKNGLSEVEGDTTVLSAAYKAWQLSLPTKPGGGAWASADFASTQIGIRSK
jgi:hypothetical protein